MGFGHRVYRNFDPRSQILKRAADQLLGQLHITDPLLDIAQELEAAALSDPYFVERKLYPNVDFYSGIILRAIGIPLEHVHRDVRHRPDARMDRQLEGDPRQPAGSHLPSPPDLRREPPDLLCLQGPTLADLFQGVVPAKAFGCSGT